MDKKLLDKINAAVDKALEDFQSNPDFIFENELERLKYQYSEPKELKNWKKNQKCIVIRCEKKSIEKSHTIQKSGSIKELAENNHILTPNFNGKTGEMEMLSVGVNEASTFPGYCLEHESLFSEFENQKDYKTGEHMGLQLYRTVCREIVINEYQKKSLENIQKRYIEFRDKMMTDAIIANLDEETLNTPTLELKNFKVKSNDRRLKYTKRQVKLIDSNLKDFLYPYRDAVLNDLKKRKFQKIAYVAMTFNQQIPVALAGKANFYYKKNVDIIMNILPRTDNTYLFFSTLEKHTNALKLFMRQFENPLLMMNAIENCMIHGSDHWFIKPSVWNKIDQDSRQRILDSINDDKYNIANKFGMTILNDLKQKYFDLADKAVSIPNDVAELIIAEKEKSTLK
ncbi:MAG TPA: hypothetical protein VNI52_03010 [Sphingobacteriaceae bacterium]|nr:hypothetical protein [Sphingobacteriaceae bacterium]